MGLFFQRGYKATSSDKHVPNTYAAAYTPMSSDEPQSLLCDEVLVAPPEAGRRKRSADEEDAHLLAQRRAKAARVAALTLTALDALAELEEMESELHEDRSDDDEEDGHLFAEREERDFLMDAQNVMMDVRERALEYVAATSRD